MSTIKYVCLSDTHFGANSSLLTNLKPASREPDPLKPSPVLTHLVECLKHLILENDDEERPTLILCGDVLELALNTMDQAAMAFSRFLELILPIKGGPLFEKIIFIPGNHDHHLWEIARETQYVNYLSKAESGTLLNVPWRATRMFGRRDRLPVESVLLWGLLRRLDHNTQRLASIKNKKRYISTFYPNFGLLSPDKTKCVLFHHGHFIESIYQLMSWLKTLVFPDSDMPTDVWDIEAENGAWIDFFWSTLGRSGQVGHDVGVIYELLKHEDLRKKLLSNLADGLAREYNVPLLPEWAEEKMASWLLNRAATCVMALERLQSKERLLSEEAKQGLQAYVAGPLRTQVLDETKERRTYERLRDALSGQTSSGGPSVAVDFVFGHTHKPFETRYNVARYPDSVSFYNTGGWVVDTIRPEPLHGAAAVLLDEQLNAVSLRLYNEASKASAYGVTVAPLVRPTESAGAFHSHINKLVKANLEERWTKFSATVADAVATRAKNLNTLLESWRRK